MRAASRHRIRQPRRGGFLLAATLTTALVWMSPPGLLDRPEAALLARQPSNAPIVAGRLIGPDLEPAAGLEVQLIPVPGSHARRLRELGVSNAVPIVDRTRSDSEGRFQLVASRAGPHQIEILPTAPRTEPPTVVTPVYVRRVLRARPNAITPVQLPKMHHLVIGVVDEEGQPVEGALVLVQASEWSEPASWLHRGKTSPTFGRASARTNEGGIARFSLPTAKSSVAVSAPGFNLSLDDLSRDRGAFRLTRGEGVTFRALDLDGAPVARAVIRVGEYQAIPLALTDDRGEATVGLAGRKGISYQIEAEDGAFARTARVKREPPLSGEPQIVEVRLWPAFELRGQVVDAETDEPVDLATIWIDDRLEGTDRGQDRLAWARPGGEFTLKTRADYVPQAIRIAAAGYVTKRVWLGPEHYAAADRRKPIRVEMRKERKRQE
ncbi:MAG: carboxypeptidase regulatory-like domain-containing protein [Acidobacteriota bacterium]|nr:carboxypeptidase regulatory-like domain-containing protein [Acidobacteriota bacterium]